MQQGSTGEMAMVAPSSSSKSGIHVWFPLLIGLLTILLFVAAVPVRAQSVREKSTFGMSSGYRRFKKAAEEQNFTAFPDVREGDKGTIASLTFDRGNADVSFFTTGVTQDELLATVKQIAQDSNLPQSDFITIESKRTRYVDMEMNDYLQKVSRSETRFDFDLSALRRALEKTDLPRPIVLVIQPDSDQVTLAEGTANRRLTDITFLRMEDVKPESRLHWKAVITWQMYVGAGFFVLLFVQMPWGPWAAARARRKQREKLALAQAEGKTADDETPDPAKIQETYDRQKPQWVSMLIMLPLTAAPLLLMTVGSDGLKPFMEGISLLVISNNPMSLAFLAVGPLALSSALCFLIEKRRDAQAKTAGAPLPADPDDEHKAPAFYNMLPMLPMLFMFVLILPLFQFPLFFKGILTGLGQIPSGLRLTVIMAALLVPSFGGMLLLTWWTHKKTRRNLQPGDYWYDEVQRMAEQAGVKVRHVVIVRSVLLNAYASIWGTVGMTSKLLARMEPDEVRAIVAHEIGHHKSRHTWRGFAISLAALAVSWGAWWLLRDTLQKQFGSSTQMRATFIMAGPLLFSFVFPVLSNLVTGKGSRKQEYEADRFAVQATGDPELVIRALRKLHTLNAQPHLLKPSDEALMSHPSLANRIEAIRRDAEGSASNTLA